MKTNKFIARLLSVFMLLLIVVALPINSLAEDAAKLDQTMDLNIHYKPKASDAVAQLLVAKPISKRKLYRLGKVTEEKSATSTQQKALEPYHRTVSMGISF